MSSCSMYSALSAAFNLVISFKYITLSFKIRFRILIINPISDFVKGFAKKFVLSEMRGESGRISSVCRIDAAG